MAMQLQENTQLNVAQDLIYSRTNIRRAFPDFDEAEIAGIYLRDDSCLVVRNDGSEQTYNREMIKMEFLSHTTRLKDFFSYLGPNYRGPSVWRQGAYIMFKGWDHTHALGHLSTPAKLQRHWADKFIHLTDIEKVKTLLQSDQTDLGHLVAPDGLWSPDRPVDLESAMEPEESSQAVEHNPYCSCGSFQRQLLNLSDFQAEIEGYRPWCIHLTWIHRYRDFLCERTRARDASPSGTPEKCVAWAYSPPRNAIEDGRFILLHTKYGMHAPISHWRTYKPNEVFTQHDAWNLFTSMMEAGYVPFPLIALPQLKASLKNESQSTSSS
jgi:hypothetical protein